MTSPLPDPTPTPAGLSSANTTTPIRWPEPFLPANTPIHVSNELLIPAPAETVWAWLIRAESWPDWYGNSSDIHFLSHTGPDLRDRSRFRWKTFGARVTSKVLEHEPPAPSIPARLAWDAQGVGISAWHAWLLTPRPDGTTHVLTEETQNGWRARLSHSLMPTRMGRGHQFWLESLAEKAKSGLPAN